ncbi:uncharacterized protein DUF1572 [Anseongella ginsenosidimutans]|uniref:Uncharacterized protein DUF1572 n=1 Tax=Anseongella ginsenosidimutans TaxID=496056 RepID=A0A4R3KT45_9SPHI|nr:DUF1572 family protein [Anseongella ginsenosidimutans]QEC53005.1 DUF1572 domain-containing protein [Anseongella ginsenosidimutans]TCS87413.1 uncharacterized protein DUF1572 [Anseongella ginsenosidimutans]
MESSYLKSIRKQLEYYKMLAEKAMEQLPEEKLFWQYNDESNSIAVIANHMAGNMISRFTDFLTTDGEKPWRNRDSEFENILSSREQLLTRWNQGWACVLQALDNLTEADLETIVYIRNDGHTVTEAINRQLAHSAYHVGQIVFIAKMIKDTGWKSLSVPRNRSGEYNQRKFDQEKGKRHFTDDL